MSGVEPDFSKIEGKLMDIDGDNEFAACVRQHLENGNYTLAEPSSRPRGRSRFNLPDPNDFVTECPLKTKSRQYHVTWFDPEDGFAILSIDFDSPEGFQYDRFFQSMFPGKEYWISWQCKGIIQDGSGDNFVSLEITVKRVTGIKVGAGGSCIVLKATAC